MTQKQIKLLALKSFIRNDLDPKRVKRFTASMKRKDLRNFIREIKTIDMRSKVTIVVPDLKSFKKNDLKTLLMQYKGKRILYDENPNLMIGLKIIDNDIVYDFNLKDSLENLIETND